MKIAVLGGGFNPPHLGHLMICEEILAFTKTREVWLMPYYAHPWDKPAISFFHRYKMCKLMANTKIKVSDFEAKMKKKNYTFATVNSLIKKYPQHEFSWIIGSDLLNEFFTWEKAAQISEQMKILVFPRAGWSVSHLPKNFYTIKSKLLTTTDVASEKIREMVKSGLSIKGLVLPQVEEYIYEHHLYY